MQFKASVVVMPHKEILDPQGKAVEGALNHLTDFPIDDVRIGKKIEFYIHAESKEKASLEVEELSRKLLANPIMEDFYIDIQFIEN